MRLPSALLLAVLIPVIASATPTPVPYILTHQGRLLGTGDQPVNEAVELRFELHETDNAAIKSPVWFDQRGVVVGGGLYSVVLGDAARGGKALDLALLDKPELFLSVTIGSTELLPRMRIPSAPYALRAARAADAERVLAGGVDTAALKDGAVTLAKLSLTGGKFVGLDADTLDGLDSSAFAPSSIETKIDAIKATGEAGATSASVTALDTKVSAVDTKVGAVAAVTDGKIDALDTTLSARIASARTDIASVKVDVAGVSTAVGTVGTTLGTLNGAVAGIATKVANDPDTWTKVQSLETQLTALTNALIPATCPSDMVLGGLAGTESAFCLEKNERGASSYFAAVRTCGSLGRHVCTQNQFWQGTKLSGATAMCNGWEWVGDRDDANTSGHLQVIIGGGDCIRQSWAWAGQHANGNGNQAFRCCTGGISSLFR